MKEEVNEVFWSHKLDFKYLPKYLGQGGGQVVYMGSLHTGQVLLHLLKISRLKMVFATSSIPLSSGQED